MALPSQLEPLEKLVERLKATAPLTAILTGGIGNHLPQDGPLPYMRVRYSKSKDWSTKTSQGFIATFIMDIWDEQETDKNILDAFDKVNEVLQNQPLATISGQSLLLRFEDANTFVESDGVTHHGVINYSHVITE